MCAHVHMRVKVYAEIADIIIFDAMVWWSTTKVVKKRVRQCSEVRQTT